MAGRLAGRGCRILIGVDEQGIPVGQVRFDETAPGDWEIDVAVDRSRRGKGYGADLLAAASAAMLREGPKRLHAYIKQGNDASIRAFQHAGYRHEGTVTVRGSIAEHYVRISED